MMEFDQRSDNRWRTDFGRNELFLSSRKIYVAGEVNEETWRSKTGNESKSAIVRLPHTHVHGRVTSIQPAADPTTQRYNVVLEMEIARQHDGRNDRGDEHHHWSARKCAARADARAARRSSAGINEELCSDERSMWRFRHWIFPRHSVVWKTAIVSFQIRKKFHSASRCASA